MRTGDQEAFGSHGGGTGLSGSMGGCRTEPILRYVL